MRGLLSFALILAAVPSLAQTVDRIVSSIGKLAITESDVEIEDRFEIFLGEQRSPVIGGTAAFEQVRDRLIDQKLLLREADRDGIPPADASAVALRLAEIRKKYKSEAGFQSALRTLGTSERQVLERLGEQGRIVQLIDQRLRPHCVVNDSEIQAYYRETLLPQYPSGSNDPAPPLTEVQGRIREVLIEKKLNQLLSEWLKQLRATYAVKIHAF